MKKKFLFLDGRMVKASDGLMEALTPGVVRRKGAFETICVVRGDVLSLEDHLARLLKGLKVLRVRASFSRKLLAGRIHRVLRVNHLRDARVRLAVWEENRRSRIAIVAEVFKRYSPSRYKKGWSAVIAETRRPQARFSHIKSLDYGCFRQAWSEAQKKKRDEAILLNRCGQLVEGSRTNVFFARKGVLYTPLVRCGCLNGLTRRAVMDLSRRMGIPCRVTAADARALKTADEIFLTNSLIGIMPVTTLEDKRVGSGGPGSITKKLIKAYCGKKHSSCPPRSKPL
ncbi:MAG TPA: aminotransferase class IV [Candidatus Omnitrophota bacterium]|nr:aminotransferase class IV [Candidatus Omnitrophota bacterium]